MDAIVKAIEDHPNDADLQSMGALSLSKIAGEVQLLNTVHAVAVRFLSFYLPFL